MLEVLVTPSFVRTVKKLHAQDQLLVDKAVKAVASDPSIGDEKKGDLALALRRHFFVEICATGLYQKA